MPNSADAYAPRGGLEAPLGQDRSAGRSRRPLLGLEGTELDRGRIPGLVWLHSTRKAELDAAARASQLQRAVKELTALREKLASPRTRYRQGAKVHEAVEAILESYRVSEWIRVDVEERALEHYHQERRGRPGKNTRYVNKTTRRFTLEYAIDHEKMATETLNDGVFPLWRSARKMSARGRGNRQRLVGGYSSTHGCRGGGLFGFADLLGLGCGGGFIRLSRLADVLLHRLAKAVTFAIHFKNEAAVCQPVQERGGHALALKYLAPIAEGQVAGDQQAGALVAVGENLEQQLGSGAAEREVAQFGADQQVGLVELREEFFQPVLLLSFFETIDQDTARAS